MATKVVSPAGKRPGPRTKESLMSRNTIWTIVGVLLIVALLIFILGRL
ncbi:MAG: hypothetical protein WA966_00620 [Ornithinimicrobium sp.]